MLDDSQLDSLELYSHHTLQVAMTNNNEQNRRLFKFYFEKPIQNKGNRFLEHLWQRRLCGELVCSPLVTNKSDDELWKDLRYNYRNLFFGDLSGIFIFFIIRND